MMATVPSFPMDTCLLFLSTGLPPPKRQGLVLKRAYSSGDPRNSVPLACFCKESAKLSRSSSYFFCSIWGGEAPLDPKEDFLSSSAASSSEESDSLPGSDHSFLPSRKSKIDDTDTSKSPAQLALEKAQAYRKSKGQISGQKPGGRQTPSAPRPDDIPQVEIIAGKAFGSSLKPLSSPVGLPMPNIVDSTVDSEVQVKASSTDGPVQSTMAFLENGQVKSDLPSIPGDDSNKQAEETPSKARDLLWKVDSASSSGDAALLAFERAKAYKKQQSEMVSALQEGDQSPASDGNSLEEKEKYLEIEIHTREGVIRRKALKPERAFSQVKETKRRGVSQMDFKGLGFTDKKSSSTPAGLMKGLEIAPPTSLPEVEIITRDATVPQSQDSFNSDSLYKPKVSSWGMFPRPADISKTYGGGRTIRPGETLETEEEKRVREARTKKLLEDYRRKMGLDVDPRIKSQSEQAMKQGERLMDQGSMRDALVIFQGVMDQIAFQSELHGLAALQGAVCLEATGRSTEARELYEKLLTHPNQTIRKKAKQLLFGFQAMDKLKFSSDYNWDVAGYRKFFDSFANGYDTTYRTTEAPTDPFLQTLPYALLLLLPIVLVVYVVASKG